MATHRIDEQMHESSRFYGRTRGSGLRTARRLLVAAACYGRARQCYHRIGASLFDAIRELQCGLGQRLGVSKGEASTAVLGKLQ